MIPYYMALYLYEAEIWCVGIRKKENQENTIK